MALTGVVAAHTGLPTLTGTAGGGPIFAGSRLLTNRTGVAVSDALAPAGVPVTYRQGSSTVTLTRASLGRRRTYLTTLTGRGYTGAWLRDGQDERSWKSPATIYESGAVRYPIRPVPRTGGGSVIVWDPDDAEGVWALLMSHQPLIVATGEPLPGVPGVRVIVVDTVRSQVLSRQAGTTGWDITWTEVPLDSPALWDSAGGDPSDTGSGTGSSLPRSGTGGAPVVTWGDWDRLDHGWRSRTYAELCSLIAGGEK